MEKELKAKKFRIYDMINEILIYVYLKLSKNF